MIRLFLTDGNFLAREALRTGLGAASEMGVLARGYLTKTSLLTELAHDLVAVGRSYQAGGGLLREQGSRAK